MSDPDTIRQVDSLLRGIVTLACLGATETQVAAIRSEGAKARALLREILAGESAPTAETPSPRTYDGRAKAVRPGGGAGWR